MKIDLLKVFLSVEGRHTCTTISSLVSVLCLEIMAIKYQIAELISTIDNSNPRGEFNRENVDLGDEPWYSIKDIATPKTFNLNFQLGVHIKLELIVSCVQ